MNQYMNEDLAWLHVQDLQRESQNRRLLAAARRPSAALAALRRLFDRSVAAVRPHEGGVEEQSDASGESRREVA